MSATVWMGLGLALFAGVMSGNCMTPSKFVKQWRWENMWLVFTLVSLVVAPALLTALTVPDPIGLYRSLSLAQYALPFALGFGWGIAQVLFGLSLSLIHI